MTALTFSRRARVHCAAVSFGLVAVVEARACGDRREAQRQRGHRRRLGLQALRLALPLATETAEEGVCGGVRRVRCWEFGALGVRLVGRRGRLGRECSRRRRWGRAPPSRRRLSSPFGAVGCGSARGSARGTGRLRTACRRFGPGGVRRRSVVVAVVVGVFGGLLVVLRGMLGGGGPARPVAAGSRRPCRGGPGGEGRSVGGVELRRRLPWLRGRPRERARRQARRSVMERSGELAQRGKSRAPSWSPGKAAGEGSEGAAVVFVHGGGCRRRGGATSGVSSPPSSSVSGGAAAAWGRGTTGRCARRRRTARRRWGGGRGGGGQGRCGRRRAAGAAGVVLFAVRAAVARSAPILISKPTICSPRVTIHRFARTFRLFRRSAERGLRAAVARCRRVRLPVRRRGVRAPGFRPGFKGLG
jgi:hypothetical protein